MDSVLERRRRVMEKGRVCRGVSDVGPGAGMNAHTVAWCIELQCVHTLPPLLSSLLPLFLSSLP